MTAKIVETPLAIIKTKADTLSVYNESLSIEFCGTDHKIYDIPLSILKDAIEFYSAEKMETKATIISS